MTQPSIAMSPLFRIAVGVLCGVTAISALGGIGLALSQRPVAAWFLLLFELPVLLAGVFGLLLARGSRIGGASGPAITLMCISGTVALASLMGYVGAGGSPFSLFNSLSSSSPTPPQPTPAPAKTPAAPPTSPSGASGSAPTPPVSTSFDAAGAVASGVVGGGAGNAPVAEVSGVRLLTPLRLRVLVALALAALGAAHVLKRRWNRSAPLLIKGIIVGLPLPIVAAMAYKRIGVAQLQSLPDIVKVVLMLFGAVILGALLCASVHFTIRAFQVGVDDDAA